MLRWSAESTGSQIDIAAIVSPDADPGIAGGRELIALADLATGFATDASGTEAVAAAIGASAAVRAASVAGAFELYNRIVDATGLPVGRVGREQLSDVIDTLGMAAFPHAHHAE